MRHTSATPGPCLQPEAALSGHLTVLVSGAPDIGTRVLAERLRDAAGSGSPSLSLHVGEHPPHWLARMSDTGPQPLVLLVVDAQRGIDTEAHRYGLFASQLGVRRLLLAVTGMERMGWREDVFARLRHQYRAYAERLGIEQLTAIPLSLEGSDNIVEPSGRLPWYQGPTLLAQLQADTKLPSDKQPVAADAQPQVADQFAAHLLWLDDQPLYPGRVYRLRLNDREVDARVSEIKHLLQIDTLERMAAKRLRRDDLAFCNLALDQALPFNAAGECPATGTFRLYERTHDTLVACGLIAFGLRRATNIHRHAMKVDKASRAAANAQKPCVLWFTGLSGAGKSTVADRVEQRLQAAGKRTMLLDGDNVRHGLNRDLGFTDEDRVENIRRVGEVSKLMVEAGLITLASFISPFRSERRMVRELLEDGEFLEIFVDAPLGVCEARDPKGLYKKARAGTLPNFTGIDSPYEPPQAPDLHLSAGELDVDTLAEQVIDLLRQRGML